ncbi:MAG: ATP-binding protein [Syntrophales bacterium]|jgi:signal transduction histidine kinase/CheY-like chemotaxis protein|nr:ATP-binding protein [Syntrophales bacterium]
MRRLPRKPPEEKPGHVSVISEDLRLAHESLLAIFDGIDEPVYVSDMDTHELLFVNRAIESFFGPPSRQKCYQYIQQRTEPCPFCTNDKIRGEYQGRSYIWEFRNEKNNHWYRCIDKTIPWPDGRLVRYEMAIDITDRKMAEQEREKLWEELAHAQKMESIGRLAGGIAHDYNNMLAVIFGHTNMALGRLKPDSPLYNDLRMIKEAAERSAALTRQLLIFSRKQNVFPQLLDLNEAVEKTTRMLSRLVDENIDLIWKPGKRAGRVRIDPLQLDQILLNLFTNAHDAVGDTGRIIIETGTAELDDTFCASRAGCTPGEYAMFTVSDNGCGMDDRVLSQLFEPFFTTKESGKGTGMGLSIVYGIVRQNGGFIDVSSIPGRGTTFHVYLPCCTEDIRAETFSEKTGAPATAGGNLTILLVDDEAMIRDIAHRMLERLGYTVMPASTPVEAIRLAREYAGTIDLLLADVVLPGINGRELADALLAIHPRMKTLFVSGYSANIIPYHGLPDNRLHFLQKPFSMKALAIKIREALGTSEP